VAIFLAKYLIKIRNIKPLKCKSIVVNNVSYAIGIPMGVNLRALSVCVVFF